DIGLIELAVAGHAEQRQADADLVFEDFEQPHDAGGAGRGERINIESATDNRVGAEDQRLDDVGAAGDAAIDHDLGATPDRLDHPREHLDRADTLVELSAAVVRDIDAIDAVVDRDHRVLGGGKTFQDQRDLELAADPLDVLPVEPCLIDAGVADPHPAAL